MKILKYLTKFFNKTTIHEENGIFFIQENKIYLLGIGCYLLNNNLKTLILKNYNYRTTKKKLYDFSLPATELSNFEIIMLINNLINLAKKNKHGFEALSSQIESNQNLFFNKMLAHPLAKNILSKNLNYLEKFTNTINVDHILNKKDDFFNLINNYSNLKNIDEVYNYITHNQNLEFKKELKNFIYDNLFTTYSHLNIFSFNTLALEPIRLVLYFNHNEIKSMKQLLFYSNHLMKLTNNDYNWWAISPYDIYHDTINLVNQCKDSSKLKILKKIDKMPHLYKDYTSFLKKHNILLDLTKEKKFYYQYRVISRKYSKKSKNFKLKNTNKGFNNSQASYFSIIENFNELFNTGNELSNCSGNYETLDYYKSHFNFIVKDDNKSYQGAIKEGKLDQLKGFKNESPSENFAKEIYFKLIKDNYIKKCDFLDFYKRCQHEDVN